MAQLVQCPALHPTSPFDLTGRLAEYPGAFQPPALTDPDVSLSAHPARAVLPSGQYGSSQCANNRGARFRTIRSHPRARLALRFSRLYLFIAQRTNIRSIRLQSGFTAVV